MRVGKRPGVQIKRFQHEDERIAWLISEVEARTSNLALAKPKSEDLELFQVTASWLTRCFALVKGLSILVQQELYAPACALQRTVWELWIDWRYLLGVGDRRLNAAKVVLSAQIETLQFADRHQGGFDSEHLAKLRQDLSDFESRNPRASVAVREQRGKRHFHWSGLTYSKMEAKLGGDGGVYGPLSWEVHGTVTAMRDVRLEVRDGSALFGFGQTEEAYRPEFLLFSAGGVLFYAYDKFADTWGLPPIELPNGE